MGHITKINSLGSELIRNEEGFSSSPYYDSAHIATIGYGFTYYPNGRRVTMQDSPITEEEAIGILEILLSHYEVAVDSMTRDDITQNQFNALVSFTYNVGIKALQTSHLLRAVNINPNDPNIHFEFEKWIYSGGKKNKGLMNRRIKEINMYYL